MKITLKRSVKVEAYEVQMTILEEEDKRSEIIPLLKAVEEAEEANIDAGEYLQEKLFYDLPQTFIRNVLEELFLMGFIDEEDRLTARGVETIETEVIMIPRMGPYKINVVDDPLIEQVILTCDPLKASLRNEIFDKTEESDRILAIPTFLQKTIGRGFKTIGTEPRMINVKEISERGSMGHQTKYLSLELQYTTYWQLKIRFRDSTTILDIPKTFKEENLIDRLLNTLSDQADLDRWRIPQHPNSLKINELKRFKKDFFLNRFESEELGYFSHISLEEVDIFPENKEAAYQWAKKLFIEELSDYMFGNKYNNEWEEFSNVYPVFREYNIAKPSSADLWNSVPFGSHKYWLLRAATDMKLEDVVEE